LISFFLFSSRCFLLPFSSSFLYFYSYSFSAFVLNSYFHIPLLFHHFPCLFVLSLYCFFFFHSLCLPLIFIFPSYFALFSVFALFIIFPYTFPVVSIFSFMLFFFVSSFRCFFVFLSLFVCFNREDGAAYSSQTSSFTYKATGCRNIHDYNLKNLLHKSLLCVRSFSVILAFYVNLSCNNSVLKLVAK
jgi:hypothetical protein